MENSLSLISITNKMIPLSLKILWNLGFLITGFVLFWFQRLLYGRLRPIESEQLYERAWFAVTETCLAMTIFRGELGGWFLVMFVSLLVGKVWGWIGEGRVEYLEQQPPANPRLFHIRLALSLVLTVLFNASMMRYCVKTVIHLARPDMMVMFGFEFAILTILSTSTLARYGIALVEIYINHLQLKAKIEERRAEIRTERLEAIQAHARAGEASPPANLPNPNDVNELEIDIPGWEEKGRWVFYLDLLTDFVKLLVYLTFFVILLSFYGLPIHILRDVVVTIRSFARRILDFLRYRNATRDMNERYPDATPEEVGTEEVCIICREDMTSVLPAQDAGDANAQPAANTARVPDRLRPKKLPCGHILHFACLRSWLERQQNCPTCRRPVLVAAAAAARGHNAANNGDGQQNIPGGNQAPGQPDAPGGGQPRARVYQFGPFRVGFGAVRGDMFHNLHQQIHQGNAPPQPPANANPQGAQIGFGFGFGRRQQAAGQAAPGPEPFPTPTPTATTPQNQPTAIPPAHRSIHEQLNAIEQQLATEINSLRIATEHYRSIHSLQLAIERIRLQQGNTAAPAPPSTGATHLPAGNSTNEYRQQLFTRPGTTAIPAGDPRLPEGLVLPAGWNLIPVQTSPEGAEQGVAPAPTNPEASTASQSTEPLFTPQVSADISTATGEGPAHAATTPIVPIPTTPTTTTVNTETPVPTWGTAPSTIQRADSPSQEWTDVQPEQASSAIPSTWGSSTDKKGGSSTETTSDGVDKGKARAPTVEEADDET